MGGTRRALPALLCMSLALLAGASVAWACTTQPYLAVRSSGAVGTTAAARPGDTVEVVLRNGSDMFANRTEIRWNAVNGPVLATVQERNFSIPVTVPANVAAGSYYLVVLARDGAGNVAGKVSTTIAVTTMAAGSEVPSARTATSDASSGFASAGEATAPSLLDPAPASGTSSETMLGVALLSAGTVALFAGFAVAEVRRRRARVSSSAGR